MRISCHELFERTLPSPVEMCGILVPPVEVFLIQQVAPVVGGVVQGRVDDGGMDAFI